MAANIKEWKDASFYFLCVGLAMRKFDFFLPSYFRQKYVVTRWKAGLHSHLSAMMRKMASDSTL